MAKTLTIQDFFKRFPDDAACVAHLFDLRYGVDFACPKCGEIGKFRKLAKQPAYTCNCGHHVHPMVGTIFQDSHTALTKWFYAVYLFTTTRHGVPAKELQRQLGVSYPTAFRMAHLIREHMARVDGDPPMSGHLEIDETYLGGKGTGKGRVGTRGKTVVLGMVERGGNLLTRVVPNSRLATLEPHILRHIARGSKISTDESLSYNDLKYRGYTHQTVNHSEKEYVRGDCHTNTLEGVWSHIKRSIRGTHVGVSAKHLQKFLGEFEFRYNLRHAPQLMFSRLVESF
jgi:transposase-like protein/predicted RNA-binding Zn-ribbon protein involved in translation (DUF1610 family)